MRRRSWPGSSAPGSARQTSKSPSAPTRSAPASRVPACYFFSPVDVVEGEAAAGVGDALLALLSSPPDAGVLGAALDEAPLSVLDEPAFSFARSFSSPPWPFLA